MNRVDSFKTARHRLPSRSSGFSRSSGYAPRHRPLRSALPAMQPLRTSVTRMSGETGSSVQVSLHQRMAIAGARMPGAGLCPPGRGRPGPSADRRSWTDSASSAWNSRGSEIALELRAVTAGLRCRRNGTAEAASEEGRNLRYRRRGYGRACLRGSTAESASPETAAEATGGGTTAELARLRLSLLSPETTAESATFRKQIA